MLRFITRTNIPITLTSEKNIEKYDSGEVVLIVSEDIVYSEEILKVAKEEPSVPILEFKGELSGEFSANDGFFIDKKMLSRGVTMEKLKTPLSGMRVFAYRQGYRGMLSLNPLVYQVIPDGEIPTNSALFPIFFNPSIVTLGELISKSFCYGFDETTGGFLELPEAQCARNKYKYLVQYEVTRIAGGLGDRLSDYGRLVSFLLSKALPGMTTEERELFSQLPVPSFQELDGIVDREKKIDQMLQQYKQGEKFVTP